jgi:membrane protease YdiL (CAAX protease family)
VLSTLIIFAAFLFADVYILLMIVKTQTQLLVLDNVFRFVFAVPCIVLTGWILRENGFRHLFRTKGLSKAIFPSLGILLLGLHYLLRFLIAAELDAEYIPQIPLIVLQQLATGFFEEPLFRGLLMAAMLLKWGDTVKGRLLAVLLAGIIFGLAHMDFIRLLGGDLSELLRWKVLNTGLMGLGFAAVYLYSGSLLGCVLLHAVYDVAVHLSNGLILTTRGGLDAVIDVALNVVLYAAIPVFAMVVCVKATPYHNHLLGDAAQK